jgi:hypothetical protein
MEDAKREILSRVANGTLTAQEAAVELQELEGGGQPAASAVADAPPPTDLARVRVVASMGSVVILGDESVHEAVADGPQRAHREGDTLVIDSIDDESGFTFGPVRFGLDVRERRLLVRMNPNLPLDAEVQAGSLRIHGVKSPIRAVVQAGSTRIEGFSAPVDLDVQAGSVKAGGLLSSGTSRIRCQAGTVSVDLDPRSSVRISAHTSLGRVSLPDTQPVSGIGAGTSQAQVGDGGGTLDIQNEMGSVTVSVTR